MDINEMIETVALGKAIIERNRGEIEKLKSDIAASQERVRELEERLKGWLDIPDEQYIKNISLNLRVKKLEAYKDDMDNAYKMTMDEKCTLNEMHCTCVPHLKMKIKELEAHGKKAGAEIKHLRSCIVDQADKSLRIKELEAELSERTKNNLKLSAAEEREYNLSGKVKKLEEALKKIKNWNALPLWISTICKKALEGK